VERDDLGEGRALCRDGVRKPIDLAIEGIADNEAALRVEHRKTARHVIDGDFERRVETGQVLCVEAQRLRIGVSVQLLKISIRRDACSGNHFSNSGNEQ
jgi:hypothetical protein